MVSIRKIAASSKLGLAGIALVAGVVGCGGSTTNNDQGASFSALGFFSAATPEPPPGLNGFITTLSQDAANSADNGLGLDTRAYIGLENRLRTSFIRVTKIDCDYDVPGASVPIPSDSWAMSSFINASPGIGGPQIGGAGGSGGVGGTNGTQAQDSGSTSAVGSTDGGPATGTGTRVYAQFPVVTPSIYAYLNANINSLPPLPFQLQVYCTATGVTNAGKVMETNPVAITAIFEEQSFVDTDGSTGGTGTGGDVNGFDSDDSGNSGDDTTTVGSNSGVLAPEGEIIPVSN